ncbi:MAG TPA: oligosaccharide flippase family protein [Acidimicrobiales bacterium]
MAARPPDARRRGSVLGLTFAIALAAPLGLITGPLVARAIGPVGRGEVASGTVFGTLAWQVLGLGLPWAVGRRVAAEPGRLRALLGNAARYCLVVTPLAIALAWFLVEGPLDGLSTAAAVGAFVLIAVAPLNIFSNVQQAALVAEGALRPMSMLRASPILFSAAVVIGCAITGTLSVGTYLAATIGAGLLVNALTWRFLPTRPRGAEPYRPLLWFGIRSAGGQLAAYGNSYLDQAILAVAVGPRQLGLYAVAATVASVPLSFGQALAARAFGDVGRASGADRWEQAGRYLRLALLVGVAASAAIALTGPFLVPLLFGRPFRGSVVPLLILLPGTAALGMGLTAMRILNAVDRPGASSIAEGSGFVVTAVGLAVAVPLAGIKGAAIVSTLAYWTRIAVQLRVLRKEGLGSVRPRWSDVRSMVRMGLDLAVRHVPFGPKGRHRRKGGRRRPGGRGGRGGQGGRRPGGSRPAMAAPTTSTDIASS